MRGVILRRLLACLALLTGLAAAGTAAPAEAATVLASPMEADASSLTVGPLQAKAVNSTPRLLRDFAGSEDFETIGGRAFLAPTVQLGSDRSRE